MPSAASLLKFHRRSPDFIFRNNVFCGLRCCHKARCGTTKVVRSYLAGGHMFNTDSLAQERAGEWRTRPGTARRYALAYETQRFTRKPAANTIPAKGLGMSQVSRPAFDDPVYLTQLRRDLLRF